MVVVRCVAAALAGAGGGEVFEDEGVGHCWCGVVVRRGWLSWEGVVERCGGC